jgi:hypothetical protein
MLGILENINIIRRNKQANLTKLKNNGSDNPQKYKSLSLQFKGIGVLSLI